MIALISLYPALAPEEVGTLLIFHSFFVLVSFLFHFVNDPGSYKPEWWYQPKSKRDVIIRIIKVLSGGGWPIVWIIYTILKGLWSACVAFAKLPDQ